LSLAVGAAGAGEIRVACYSDGNECEVTQDLAKRFEAQNADVKVVIDKVPYKAILEQLPVQLAAGEGPDVARVTDLGGLSKYYLDITPYVKDPKYWEANFGQTLPWMRPTAGDKGIYGMMTQLTVTGPYVNKTLFEQAKVPLPGPQATWDQWADAARKVAKATQVPYAIAFDRSGHRFAGTAISMGSKFFDAKGNLIVDDGYKAMAKKLYDWNKDGTMPKEIWGGVGGSTYRDAFEEFANGRVVMYLSGSWQIRRMDTQIGKNFDWIAVPNPLRAGGVHGNSRRRRVRGAEAHQESEGRRALPRLSGERARLRRIHGTHREHPGERQRCEEGRRLQDFAGREVGDECLRRRGAEALARGVRDPGLPAQSRDFQSDRGAARAGHRR
jgi:alpha-1,4-digalacturonate transport system substrate-binding protein